MDIVNEWLESMGSKSGQQISLDKDGGCSIEWDKNVVMVVDSQEESPVFHISSPVMEIPATGTEDLLELFTRALSLNMFTQQTRGTTIAMAEETGQIMLCFMQEKDTCDAHKFSAILEGFYETVQDIRQKLEDVAIDGSGKRDSGVGDIGVFV